MAQAKVVRREDVVPITWGGEESARFLLRGADTGGLFSLYEVSLPAGEGSIYHMHEAMDETFYVTAGELEIKVADDVHEAPAGVMVYGPRGVAHSFYNPGDRTATMLCVTAPAGIEDFFDDLSRLVLTVPPPDWFAMRALAARHRIVAFRPMGGPHGGPPLATGAVTGGAR